MEFSGSVAEIIFESTRDQYKVLLVEGKDQVLVVHGSLPGLGIGDHGTFRGKMENHPRFGEQLRVLSFDYDQPSDIHSIELFLSSGHIRGLGPVLASRIVEKFGAGTLDVMTYEIEKLRQVAGIGKKTLELIKKDYEALGAKKESLIYVQSLGFSPLLSGRIISEFGPAARQIIEDNPYNLMEIDGIGFESCEKLAQEQGFNPGDLRRLQAFIKGQLQRALNQGHIYLPRNYLLEDMDYLGYFDEEDLRELLIQGSFIEEKSRIYLPLAYEVEGKVAAYLTRLNKTKANKLDYDLESLDNELSDEQLEALEKSLNQSISIITGGPGTGKTTLIKAMTELFNDGLKLCAPTGRAAKRMEEATDHAAQTIHRLLEYKFDEERGILGFDRNEENPLEADIVVVDEVSMVDIFLMRNLLEALETGVRLILIGDEDQLPSVGPGRVLGDMIASGVIQVSRLKEIFRQDQHSLIPINAGKVLRGDKELLMDSKGDFFILSSQGPQGLVELVRDRLSSYYDYDPLWEIQVLSPMKNGPLGTRNLNQQLQEALNPYEGGPRIQLGDSFFQIGDKIMQNRNNYQIEWRDLKTGEEGQGIFNGDIGEIVDIKKGEISIIFDRTRKAVYTREQLFDIDHAYAMTIHKSQGSEFACVVLAAQGVPPLLANRNLLYTGITRAKELLVLYHGGGSLKRMISQIDSQERYSSLKELLIDYNMEE